MNMIDWDKLRSTMIEQIGTDDTDYIHICFFANEGMTKDEIVCFMNGARTLSADIFCLVCATIGKPMDEFAIKPHGGLVTWNEMLGLADAIAGKIGEHTPTSSALALQDIAGAIREMAAKRGPDET